MKEWLAQMVELKLINHTKIASNLFYKNYANKLNYAEFNGKSFKAYRILLELKILTNITPY